MCFATGAAYIFDRSGSPWAESQKLIASDASLGDRFGWDVGVDGDWAIVSAIRDDDLGDSTGSVYVFTDNDRTERE